MTDEIHGTYEDSINGGNGMIGADVLLADETVTDDSIIHPRLTTETVRELSRPVNKSVEIQRVKE